LAARRRRRSIDLAAAGPVGDGSTGDDWNTGNREVGCFGLGGNGGGSEREDRRTQIYHVARYRVMTVGKSRLVPRLTLSW